MARFRFLTIPLLCLLLNLLRAASSAAAVYDVAHFGAKPDGRTDSSRAFVAAWKRACGSDRQAEVVVPKGRFLVSRALFEGPCKSNASRFLIRGTVLGDSRFSKAGTEWITFKYVDGLLISGGTFDARGHSLWACKAAGRICPTGSTALTIGRSKNVVLSRITVRNSQNFQIAIVFSSAVTVTGARISAPADSPNTDGIHLHMSSLVTITDSVIRTGDDCISVGTGVNDTWIERIRCGPGHGISIGSLGGSPGESVVRNVTARWVALTGTQNGLRIKTWANPYKGNVRGVVFQHVRMKDVQNPIIIDQNYCPRAINCPKQSSGIKISGLVFSDVKGTSGTEVAVKLDCSRTNPCTGILLHNIHLTYDPQKAKQQQQQKQQIRALALCNYANGRTFGSVVPPSCL